MCVITGIHVPYTNNNEPGHGGSLADTSGANLKAALWRWTFAHLKPITNAMMAVQAAEDERVNGHVTLLAWHDPTQEWEMTGVLLIE